MKTAIKNLLFGTSLNTDKITNIVYLLFCLHISFPVFVIAFVWYDEPLFIRGMYYQQLLFWAFALIAVRGGVAYDGGFNSKATFNRAFKKSHGEVAKGFGSTNKCWECLTFYVSLKNILKIKFKPN